jgi:glycine cleavage system transcriptional repressor
MNKLIISVLGEDRPGIIAAVTRVLHDQDYNIEEVSQTILQNQFSCFFIVAGPVEISPGQLVKALQDNTSIFDLFFHVHELGMDAAASRASQSEPFVVTTRGPDRKGLVAGITAVFAAYNVNVGQLRAVFRGGDEPGNNTMIYEVDIPLNADQKELRKALCEKAEELNLEISIQHRNIFEAMNRIL